MRRKEKEIRSRKEIERIIKKVKVCRVGFIDDCRPYVLPFNFGYKKGVFYMHCAPKGRKIDALKGNRNVCVEIDCDHELKKFKVACKSGFKYRSVVAEGKARVINGRGKKIEALKIIMRHQTGRSGYEFLPESLDRTRVIVIKAAKITGKQSGYG